MRVWIVADALVRAGAMSMFRELARRGRYKVHVRAGDVRRQGNIGDELARKLLTALPDSQRLRPPFPAKDWCAVTP